jgi:hypothetical protein
MYRLKVFPYKLGSSSAKALANGLRVKRVRSTYEPRRNDVIINWGRSSPITYVRTHLDLNNHEAIALACNKLKTFTKLSSNGFEDLPNWCTGILNAVNWINDGNKVYCRTSLTGHSGSGIVIASSINQLVDAPLYTKATRHKYEYRVHVFRESVIDVQQKKRRSNWTGGDTGIRNHSNGYIYARADIDYPQEIKQAAIQAVKLLGLDFGAVDIGYREQDNKIFLFEVNTAPGLTGTTLDKYVQAFKEYINDQT